MFDVLTIAAVTDELTATVLDGRVQQVGLVTWRTVAFEIYANGRRHHLIASAESDDARLLLTDSAPAIDRQLVTPFLLLLRKYVRGGVIAGIEQPPLERLVRVSIAKGQRGHNRDDTDSEILPDFDEEELDGVADAVFTHLSIELMGRQSNLILVDDDGLVMESAKRVTRQMSRVRPIAPKLRFTPPPVAGDRQDPRKLTASLTEMLLANAPARGSLVPHLTRSLRGVSPRMAREALYRACGDAEAERGAVQAAELAREMRHQLEPLLTGAWDPHVYLDAEGTAVAFAALPQHHLDAGHEVRAVASISAAAAMVVEPAAEDLAPTRHAQRRRRLIDAIGSASERVLNRITSLQEEAAKGKDAERYRIWGELIYAYLWQIQPGQAELVVDDERVPLDPRRSAKEMAQDYFEQYRSAQASGANTPTLIAAAESELAYLGQLTTLASQATAFQDLEALEIEWDAHQRPRTQTKPRKRTAPAKRPKPIWDELGNAIYIGRSGSENDAITFGIAGPEDTWLHARGVPGSHVIVRWVNPQAGEDPATLERAAAIAAYYSASRESGTVEVDIAKRKHVRKIKGAGPGMVTYRNERTIRVRPERGEAPA